MPFDSIGGLLAIYVEFKCLPDDEISVNIWLPENHSKSVKTCCLLIMVIEIFNNGIYL